MKRIIVLLVLILLVGFTPGFLPKEVVALEALSLEIPGMASGKSR